MTPTLPLSRSSKKGPVTLQSAPGCSGKQLPCCFSETPAGAPGCSKSGFVAASRSDQQVFLGALISTCKTASRADLGHAWLLQEVAAKRLIRAVRCAHWLRQEAALKRLVGVGKYSLKGHPPLLEGAGGPSELCKAVGGQGAAPAGEAHPWRCVPLH